MLFSFGILIISLFSLNTGSTSGGVLDLLLVGFGDVEDEITRFSLPNLKETRGFGLRFLFNEEEKISLRVDIGFGKDTNGIYFGMEEAF